MMIITSTVITNGRVCGFGSRGVVTAAVLFVANRFHRVLKRRGLSSDVCADKGKYLLVGENFNLRGIVMFETLSIVVAATMLLLPLLLVSLIFVRPQALHANDGDEVGDNLVRLLDAHEHVD